MDNLTIWNSFLKNLETKVNPILFQTWFENTKLLKLENEHAIVIVPFDVHKKHLKENYEEIIKESFFEVTGKIYTFEYLTEKEYEEKNTVKENEEAIFDSGLDPKYTFESFVAGESNKFAKAIGLAVAEKPGSMYNPLFIYGNSGLGKTHLMHAIGNYIKDNTNKKVRYVTSEKFVSDFLSLYRQKDNYQNFKAVDNFKNKYRDIDVLMIDDIQYLEIASKTQQEFFNTFNELHTNNKQIIISSDRSPDDLKKLEERLRTRFNWGLTIDILPPEFELRKAILNKKIEAQGINSYFPDEVKEYIAQNCTSDIRKLEGALTRVFAYATILNGSEITLNLAMEALKDMIGKNIISKNKIDKVIKIVADKYNITPEDIKGKKRLKKISVPRQVSMYICRIYLKESLPKIGSEFGGKDHTTVMHAVNKIKKEIQKDNKLKEDINHLIKEINLG